MKRMFPNSEDYKAVLSQHTKFTNKEGIYGDADIMSLTQDDSEHAIPTYQFWSEHGMLMLYVNTLLVSCYATSLLHCTTIIFLSVLQAMRSHC